MADTGRLAAVYNCRVADHHTYFVGADDWGFALWAHNIYVPGKHVSTVTARHVNRSFDPLWHAPYKLGTRVVRFVTTKIQDFVRVHGDNNKFGSWLMRRSAIKGMTPEQIQQKYALPVAPTHVSRVRVPVGTKMDYGTVNPGFPGVQAGGRARQYRLLERLAPEAFFDTRPL